MTIVSPVKRLVLEITRKCRFHCLHCSVRGGEEVFEKELDFDIFAAAIDDFASLGGVEVAFTGGEPLERRQLLLSLIGRAKSCGLRTIAYSVGYSLTELNVNELAKAGLDEVYLSLEGSRETHERITGIPGSYALALRATSRLKTHGIKVSFHFTPMSINYKDFGHVCNVARLNRVMCIKVLNFVPHGRGFDNSSLLALSSDQRREFHRIFQRETGLGIDFDFGGRLFDFDGIPSSCQASQKIVLTNHGPVIPCSSQRSSQIDGRPEPDFVIGDLRTSRLSEILRKRFQGPSEVSNSCPDLIHLENRTPSMNKTRLEDQEDLMCRCNGSDRPSSNSIEAHT